MVGMAAVPTMAVVRIAALARAVGGGPKAARKTKALPPSPPHHPPLSLLYSWSSFNHSRSAYHSKTRHARMQVDVASALLDGTRTLVAWPQWLEGTDVWTRTETQTEVAWSTIARHADTI